MTNKEIFTARDQLMDDILAIMESFFPNEDTDKVEIYLCNAVISNFPKK